MEQIARRVGQTVLAAIGDAGLSMRTVSVETGIAVATLSRKCNGLGRSSFDVLELVQIARITGRNVSDLLPEDLRA
jgi:lambda repressor-like predicted transcriptional regulator